MMPIEKKETERNTDPGELRDDRLEMVTGGDGPEHPEPKEPSIPGLEIIGPYAF